MSAAASIPGQHRADRRPAPVRRHENRHLLAREAALLRLAAPPPCLAPQPARALPALQDVGLVRFHDPLEHLRIAPRRRQKPVTPAERRAHRHVAARRRRLHEMNVSPFASDAPNDSQRSLWCKPDSGVPVSALKVLPQSLHW